MRVPPLVLTLPTTLRGRYRLLDRLGSGGYADVYRGEDLVLERPVAVKVVRDLEAVASQPFAREIAALSRLAHPAIVRLFDGGTDGSLAYLVMELVEGRSLEDLLAAEGALELERAREIGRQVAAALAHAHAVGLVHRDVKPGNILVDDSARVRVTDFGVARIVDQTVTTTTGTLGTAAYLAPEQVESARVGPVADVYALGLVLLECLTGERAFPGPLTEAAVARLSRDPDIPADLPGPWPALLAGMTARRPDDRPSATALARELEHPSAHRSTVPLAESHDDPARTQVLPRAETAAGRERPGAAAGQKRPGAAGPERPAAAAGPERPAAAGQKRPGAAAGNRALVALVVALIVLAGWLFLRGGEPAQLEADEPPPPSDLDEALDRLEEAVRP